jgi:uncharacterized cupredoxin-like copper-binding protein
MPVATELTLSGRRRSGGRAAVTAGPARYLYRGMALAVPLNLGIAAVALAAEPPSITVEMVNRGDGSQSMRLDRTQVTPGMVTFRVHNLSSDMVHEFLVLRTALVPAQFPMQDAGSQIDEGKFDRIVELGDLEPGKSGALAITLQPGHYVLFCNEAGHFAGGMHAELTVVK